MKAKGEPGKRLCIFETDINNDPFERETESPARPSYPAKNNRLATTWTVATWSMI